MTDIDTEYATARWHEALCDDLMRAGDQNRDSSHDAADAIARILRGVATIEFLHSDQEVKLREAAEVLETMIGNASATPARAAA